MHIKLPFSRGANQAQGNFSLGGNNFQPASGAAALSYEDLVLSYNPEYYFPLNETTGVGSVANLGSVGGTGTVVNNSLTPVADFVSGAILRDGSTGSSTHGGLRKIDCGGSTFNPQKGTAMIWAKTGSDRSGDTICGQYVTSRRWLLTDGVATVQGTVYNDGVSNHDVTINNSNAEPSTGPHFYMLTWDWDDLALNLYVDGDAFTASASLTGVKEASSSPIFIGGLNISNSTGTFQGDVSDFVLLSQELTAADAIALYAAGAL